MEGPDHTYDHPGHIWNVYKRVAEEAEEAPEFEGLIPEGGLIAAITQVMERLSTDPFTVTVPHPETGVPTEVLFSRESVAGEGLAQGFSGDLPSWPADVIALANGDFTAAAQRAIRQRDSARSELPTSQLLFVGLWFGHHTREVGGIRGRPGSGTHRNVGLGISGRVPCVAQRPRG